MYIRAITEKALALSKKMPVIAFLGPRQSGKTTLSQSIFNKHAYISLEDIDNRTFATNDPRTFLTKYPNEHGIIIDEIQHVPELLSYIQTASDQKNQPGFFILTGSQNFLINQAITQTLAGRIAILTLLPLSIEELKLNNLIQDNAHDKVEKVILKGGYPRIYDKNLDTYDWFPSYIRTYIERDIRQIKNITDVGIFQLFMKLCAGRIGQILNLTSLGNDCGISSVTAKAWLSLLQQSYIIFLLQPHYKNFNKRLVKTPKLYFYDTGLACSLLDIDSEKALYSHYLRGGLFESLIISDFYKNYFNKGRNPNLYYWQNQTGNEVDCIIERETSLIPVEMKAGRTVGSEYFTGLKYWNELTDSKGGYIVYAGNEIQERTQGTIVSWYDASSYIFKSLNI